MDTRVTQVNLGNARTGDQREAMERIRMRNECPFCWENLQKEHRQPILYQGPHWLVTPNQWPYPEAEMHLLIISREHVEDPFSLPLHAFSDLRSVLRWMRRELGLEGGGLCVRFGDFCYNGATVRHLHWHLLVPRKPDEAGYEPIRFFIGGQTKKPPPP